MTITRRINLTVAILLVLMIAIGVIGLVAALRLDTWSSDYDDTLARAQAAASVSESASHMFIYGAAAVTAQDSATRADFESARWTKRAQAAEALNTLSGLQARNAADATVLQTLKTSFDEFDTALAAALTLSNTDPQQALTDVTSKVQPLALRLGEAASSYLTDVQTQERAEVSEMNGEVRTMLMIIAIVLAAGVVIGIVLAIRLSRKLRRQLGEAISSLSSSAAELMAIASQVAASTAQTATATTETTATVEEVKQTAELAQEKAAEVAEHSQNVATGAEVGREYTEASIAAFEGIANQMGLVAEAIDRLSNQTQAVGDIVASVNDLAEQSNLLSVNASIEAAKAGEQGRGFTVVAQEVKSLAEQSKQGVAQIRSILSEIQKASNVAVQTAKEGRESVEASRRQVVEARDRTHQLANSANEAAQSATQISATSRQQLAGMEQIKQAIESINQAGAQAAAGTRHVEREVSGLQELALRLKRLVDAGATA